MLDELRLNDPGWEFIFSDERGSAVVSQIKQAQEKSRPSLSLFKTTTGRRRIYLFSPEGSPEKFLIKAYLPAKLGKRMKYLVRNSRCAQEFFAAKKLAELKIPAVKAIAFGYRREGLFPAEELVLEPFWEGLQPFDRAWKKMESEGRKALFISLARLVSELDQKGILQRDFKPDSILVRKTGPGFELILSDLERIKFYPGPLSRGNRISNLGKMLQGFFRIESCPEMEWFLEEYSKTAGDDFSKGRLRRKVILSGIRQLKRHAEKRQSWAKDTNELIEKFKTAGLELRVSREPGKSAVETFLESTHLPDHGVIAIGNNNLEMIEAGSGQAVMEKYFYLRELRINCRAILLAVELPGGREGLAGIEFTEGARPIKEFFGPSFSGNRKQALAALGQFLFRMDLFGVKVIGAPGELILAKTSDSGFEFKISRPDRLLFSRSRLSKIPDFDNSPLLTRLLGDAFLESSEITFLKQGFESQKLF